MDQTSMIKKDLKDFIFERVLKANSESKFIYILGHMKEDADTDQKAIMRLEKE